MVVFMKKGCVISLIVLVLLAIAGGVLVVKFGKKAMGVGQASALFVVEEAIKNYKKASPDALPADNTNEAWAAVLQGTDHDQISVNGKPVRLELDHFIQEGKITDLMGQTPVTLQTSANGEITAVLPGKDGQLGTEDDVTSAAFRNLVNMGKK